MIDDNVTTKHDRFALLVLVTSSLSLSLHGENVSSRMDVVDELVQAG